MERQRTPDPGQQLQLQVALLLQRQRETGRLAPMQLMRISAAPRPPTASSDPRLGDSSAIISLSMMTTLPAPAARLSLAQRQTVGAELMDRRHQEERQCRGQERIRVDAGESADRTQANLEDHEYSRHSERTQRKFAYMIRTGGLIHHTHKTKHFRQRVLPKHWEITSLPNDFVHYEQARSLTVRAYARIQTFPDWYRFVGPRTTGGLRRAGNPLQNMFSRNLPKYTQIANAVPRHAAISVTCRSSTGLKVSRACAIARAAANGDERSTSRGKRVGISPFGSRRCCYA